METLKTLPGAAPEGREAACARRTLETPPALQERGSRRAGGGCGGELRCWGGGGGGCGAVSALAVTA